MGFRCKDVEIGRAWETDICQWVSGARMLRLGELGETDICGWVSGARMLRLGELGETDICGWVSGARMLGLYSVARQNLLKGAKSDRSIVKSCCITLLT